MGSSVWVGDRLEACRKWYFMGLSATEIAGEFGDGTTRNSIIGVIHRQGWNKLPDAPRGSDKMYGHGVKRIRVRSKPKPKRPVMGMPALLEVVTTPVPILADDGSDIPIQQRCTIFDLSPTTCRYPYGEPGTEGFFFCGGEALPKLSYCPSHCDLCFTPVHRRR